MIGMSSTSQKMISACFKIFTALFFLHFALFAQKSQQEILQSILLAQDITAPSPPIIDKVAEPISPNVRQEFGSLVLEKKVKRGDIFSARILLEQQNDILIVSKIDNRFLQNVSVENLSGEVVFSFRALKTGLTEVTIDRIADKFQYPYVQYQIFIEPSLVDLENEQRQRDQQKKKDLAKQTEKKEIETLISQGLLDRAKKQLTAFIDRYGVSKEVIDLTDNISTMMEEKGQIEEVMELMNTLIKQQGNSEAALVLRLRFARLLKEQGKTSEASDQLLDILTIAGDVKKQDAMAIYAAKAFVMLGDLLFLEKQYASARDRYEQFLMIFDMLGPAQKAEVSKDRLIANFHIAQSYEFDEKSRDYKKAFQYYNNVEVLADQFDYSSDNIEEGEAWREKARDRKTFVSEHFLNVR